MRGVSGDPSHRDAVQAELDRYFLEIHSRRKPHRKTRSWPNSTRRCPGKYAKQAERIYRCYVESS
jgi:hypothetical protein